MCMDSSTFLFMKSWCSTASRHVVMSLYNETTVVGELTSRIWWASHAHAVVQKGYRATTKRFSGFIHYSGFVLIVTLFTGGGILAGGHLVFLCQHSELRQEAYPRNLDSLHSMFQLGLWVLSMKWLAILTRRWVLFVPRLACKWDFINFNVEHTCTQLVLSIKTVIVILMLWHCEVMDGRRGGLKPNVTMTLWLPQLVWTSPLNLF